MFRKITMLVSLAIALHGQTAPAVAQEATAIELQFLELPATRPLQDVPFSEILPLRATAALYHLSANRPEIAAATRRQWRTMTQREPVYVFEQWVEGTVPFFRFLNNEGNHFFTIHRSEGASAVTRYNYRQEGICCYIAASQLPGTVPLYRLRRLGSPNVHRYIVDPFERQELEARGHEFEGIAGYVWTTPAVRSVLPGQPRPLDTGAAGQLQSGLVPQ